MEMTLAGAPKPNDAQDTVGRLIALREQIARRTRDCDRAPDSVKLVAVSKTFSADEIWPTIANGLLMTVVLLTSSFTMVAATVAARDGKQSRALQWLAATIVLGTVFAVLHVTEWVTMFHEGWSTATNPLGGSTLVGGTFFIITGLSLLHVIAGIIALLVIAGGYRRGRWDASYIETTGLYWQFVDVVWMFVFPLVYLLNAK